MYVYKIRVRNFDMNGGNDYADHVIQSEAVLGVASSDSMFVLMENGGAIKFVCLLSNLIHAKVVDNVSN